MIFSACTETYYEPRYDPRDRVVGYYEVEEYSDTFDDITYYSLRISKSGYDDELYLNNFYAVNIRVYAILDDNYIRIPWQVVDGYEIEGSGTVHRNKLHLNYRVKDRYNHTPADYCETTAWFDY